MNSNDLIKIAELMKGAGANFHTLQRLVKSEVPEVAMEARLALKRLGKVHDLHTSVTGSMDSMFSNARATAASGGKDLARLDKEFNASHKITEMRQRELTGMMDLVDAHAAEADRLAAKAPKTKIKPSAKPTTSLTGKNTDEGYW